MASPIKNNPFTAEQHLRYFAEFCQGVAWTGGTTPHMLMAVQAGKGHDLREQLWRAGCYGFVYNMPTAEILWANLAPGELSHDELEKWLIDNWKGIKLRKERKAVNTPIKMTKCMTSYAAWMENVPGKEWFFNDSLDPVTRYQLAFDDIGNNVWGMGRYITIRLIEVFARMFKLEMPMPDLRPRDGDHPRKALALMYPEYEVELMGGNDDETIKIVNDVVEICREDLEELYGIDVDYYTMQSLLCEYKQSCLSRRQYPGKSIDTFLAYFKKVYDYWGQEEAEQTELWDVRKAIFPIWSLGEVQGWMWTREELGATLQDYGYTWSDILHDYKATKEAGDFGNPVKREAYYANGRDPWFHVL